ncbi:TetR/AcrR family transcriptional regulator [Streptomyces albireticuli]|uniref:Transcriptional regulator n=1 Tax=Streptomyces albireticuli TaxID=1940 RepID=A0A2A2D2C1_9ACTN|nr:TetR/AcrR family transcriptional regulator [Streptomyces albireticuli]MCD9143431.1 TetR/AcrR family transcriptional regulator [Streptomyces albireticuli]MCD9164790.1 TetR/AcrR family transcriptional regulator [Streptomyces albireticuli]MCD9191548.1 TetR/AcrR family transcriptional regulator [Streptomyces albireticuli]PAU45462.1 transcriptional regulator [Streptomyces albireticuli]
MPRQADHDQRRRQIAEAVWRLASRSGLEDVTLRQVAAEAGVSVRLVQYYFGNRDGLLLTSLEILNADAERRAKERVEAAEEAPTSRGTVRGVLLELLPLDEERRTRQLVYVAYFVRFLNDEKLGAVARDAPPELERLVAGLIAWGQERGEVPADLDPRPEAELLLAATDGLQTSVLLGQRTPEEAVALVDHQLNRLFVGVGYDRPGHPPGGRAGDVTAR